MKLSDKGWREHISKIKYKGKNKDIVIPIEKAIKMITEKQCKFFTENQGGKAYVTVIDRNKKAYLRTSPDHDKGNNLLLLPTF